MTWKLTTYGRTRRALPGVKWEDLTDEEYEAAKALHPGMEKQGYFIRVEEEDSTPPSSSRRAKVTEEKTDGR